jgi:hypothetical protein
MYEYLFGSPIVLALGLCIGLYGYLVRVHQWTWLVAGSDRTALPREDLASMVGSFILALGVVVTAYGAFFQTTSINSVWVTHSFTIAVVGLTLWTLHRLTTYEPRDRQESIAPADD